MSLSHYQRSQRRRIEASLRRSDPKLASMLGMFGRPGAGQRMPAWEQAPSRPGRIRQAAALLAKTATVIAAAIRLLPAAARLLPAAARLLPAAARALAAPVVPGGRARPWAPETGGAAAARRPAADRIWPGGADHL
jgi:Protein of unknown function (DUF3040)